MMAAVKAGGNRQEMHELLRTYALQAWEVVQSGKPNPLNDYLRDDKTIRSLIPVNELNKYLKIDGYSGIAPLRARQIAQTIQTTIK